jgi:hypothetical protein
VRIVAALAWVLIVSVVVTSLIAITVFAAALIVYLISLAVP